MADILEAAVRVLVREGARHFTTVRVAEEAGVSVGSLYQYFPNKEALLFRLQMDEWEDTYSLLDEILSDAALTPRARLEKAVLVFFRSEREEAHLRRALDDLGALFRDAPEARAFGTRVRRRMHAFFGELMPQVETRARALASDVVLTALGAVAEKITAQGMSRRTLDVWATANAAMYLAYVDSLC